jgi:hypothetical protein
MLQENAPTLKAATAEQAALDEMVMAQEPDAEVRIDVSFFVLRHARSSISSG